MIRKVIHSKITMTAGDGRSRRAFMLGLGMFGLFRSMKKFVGFKSGLVHGCWDQTYSDDEVMKWLFAQKLR